VEEQVITFTFCYTVLTRPTAVGLYFLSISITKVDKSKSDLQPHSSSMEIMPFDDSIGHI